MMRALALSVTAASIAACSPDSATVAIHARHCAGLVLSTRLLVNISAYHGGEGDEQFAVEACHLTGTACTLLATYGHASPPSFLLQQDGRLTMTLVGGDRVNVRQSQFNVGSAKYRFIVKNPNVAEDVVRPIGNSVICPQPPHSYPR